MSVLLERYKVLCSGQNSPVDLLAFLSEFPEASFEDRVEVVLFDQRWRWLAGIGRQVEEYLADLPEMAGDTRVRERLIEGEKSLVREMSRGHQVDRSQVPTEPDLTETIGDLQHPESLATTEDDLSQRGISEPEPGMTGVPAVLRSTYRQEPPLTVSVSDQLLNVAPVQIESNGRFQILDKLGAGGMGIVYQALDRRRGETVALKTMKQVNPLSLFWFKQEFRSLADLSHPNLINLYELISVRGQWFFTMELLTGTDFSSTSDEGQTRRDPDARHRDGDY